MNTNRLPMTTLSFNQGLALLAGSALLLGVISGCEATKRFTADPLLVNEEASAGSAAALEPKDFMARESSTDGRAGMDTSGSSAAQETGSTVTASGTAPFGNSNDEEELPPPPPAPRLEYVASAQPGVTVTVAGLVGQVNGRPIYVDDVFAPIADQLALMSYEMNYSEFQQKALVVISRRVRQMVENELLLAEAMGQLTSPQQEGLLNFIRNFEDGLIRESGGSAQKAERRLLEEKGVTLSEQVDRFRDDILIQEQFRTAIRSKITVTWRDVERYYREHPAEFNPTSSIQLRILVISKDHAEKQADIEAALAAGHPFELAIEDYADLMVSVRGLMGTIELPDGRAGAKLTVWPLVNAAAETLEVGVPAGPFVEESHIVWIQIEHYEDGAPIPLRDAQKQIENKIWSQYEAEATAKYFRKLLSRGNFDDLELMSNSLLAVALDRWAPAD